ncbi:ankyrin repeat domain-containing protein [Alkalimonas delamerensis]|uniref:Ankyrin repeat domain-containing protein n=1 Tax=Alkalimonas delamerensis TaxID=265981 RepID=A0ABT9GQM6_9GAMM|nr:ankyrin repeat domain-containing protein [Alkalimonas delamerensis]MDP4529272.1 ankyrin repeat domain-containing protein [Alkalimonas delamerensis]
MDSKQRAMHASSRYEFVSRIPLRHMFPDELSRALADAAGRGRIAQIDQKVAQGADVNARGELGVTPLYWPIKQNNIHGFRRLLELGADPNAIFYDGMSVMFFAAQNENLEFLRLALEHGADPNLVSGARSTALESQGNEHGFKGETPLAHVIIYNPNAIAGIDMLLAHGADISARTIPTPLGNSLCLLMSATVGPKYDVALHLLERGADYNFANENGYGFLAILTRHWTGYPADTPERRKVIADMQKVVDWLTERGVEIPERN